MVDIDDEDDDDDDELSSNFPARSGHLICCSRWFLGHRFSLLMVEPQQAVPYLPLLVTIL